MIDKFDSLQWIFISVQIVLLIVLIHYMRKYSKIYSGIIRDPYSIACFILLGFSLLVKIFLRSIILFKIEVEQHSNISNYFN